MALRLPREEAWRGGDSIWIIVQLWPDVSVGAVTIIREERRGGVSEGVRGEGVRGVGRTTADPIASLAVQTWGQF